VLGCADPEGDHHTLERVTWPWNARTPAHRGLLLIININQLLHRESSCVQLWCITTCWLQHWSHLLALVVSHVAGLLFMCLLSWPAPGLLAGLLNGLVSDLCAPCIHGVCRGSMQQRRLWAPIHSVSDTGDSDRTIRASVPLTKGPLTIGRQDDSGIGQFIVVPKPRERAANFLVRGGRH
jgi:hypothetical protein